MGKIPLLLAVERAQIAALHMERLSKRQITKRLRCSKSSVYRAIETFKKHKIYDDMKKTSKPRKTSRRNDHAIQRGVMRSPLVLVVKYVPTC